MVFRKGNRPVKLTALITNSPIKLIALLLIRAVNLTDLEHYTHSLSNKRSFFRPREKDISMDTPSFLKQQLTIHYSSENWIGP